MHPSASIDLWSAPNSCGASDLQHQHLEEHVSSQCPLTPVECEFHYAGCDAKVHRRDLPSHLSNNMVTHMSLLARENRKLKQQLREEFKQELAIQDKENKMLEQQLKTQEQQLREEFKRELAIQERDYKRLEQQLMSQEQQLKTQEQQLREEFKRELAIQDIKQHSKMQKKNLARILCVPPLLLNVMFNKKSEPFYSHAGGYKLQLETSMSVFTLNIKFILLESEFAVRLPCKLQITAKLINQAKDEDHVVVNYTTDSSKDAKNQFASYPFRSKFADYNVNCNLKFQISEVLVL